MISPGPPLDFSFKGLTQLSEICPNTDDLQPPSIGESPAGIRALQEAPRTTGVAHVESTEILEGTKGPSTSPQLSAKQTPGLPAAGDAKGQAVPVPVVSPFPPTPRKSICVTKSDRVVSVCSLMMRGQHNSVIKEVKESKMHVSLVPIAVRLNNNDLTEAPDLPFHLSRIMQFPAQNLLWLDLSFNRLTNVPLSLNELYSLTSLYLHCNAIANPAEVCVLKKNKNLKFLTLTGNPFEQDLVGSYRSAAPHF